jgi:ABC-type transporter Mla maintaining outer membrane lipid asymmetry permease subunit MlaE
LLPLLLLLPGKIHWRNTRDQLQLVGPKSLGVALLTAGFVGMVFTIQVGNSNSNSTSSSSMRTVRYEEQHSSNPSAAAAAAGA